MLVALIVEDERPISQLEQIHLRMLGIKSIVDINLDRILQDIEDGRYQFGIVDLNIHDSGVNYYKHIREHQPEFRMIIVSGFIDFRVSKMIDADPYCTGLRKPHTLTELKRHVQEALQIDTIIVADTVQDINH